MKIAAFSDVHGNLNAFRKVVAAMKAESPDLYIFCGDLCGYYYDQNEIVDELMKLKPLVSVLGNHDAYFLTLLDDESRMDELSHKYGSSYQRLKNNLKPQTLDFLKSLSMKAEINEIGMAVFHGSPWNPLEEYIYPTNDFSKFSSLPYSYVVLGHTHYPMHKKVGAVQIINPGSCGQPRDEGRPSFALIDTDRDQVTIRRVDYDANALRTQIGNFDPGNPYLRDVLDRKPKEVSR